LSEFRKLVFLWSFGKLTLDTVMMLKSLAFQICLTATGTCSSTWLLQSKHHEQELIMPKEILYPWACCVCKRKPSFRFISRTFLWRV